MAKNLLTAFLLSGLLHSAQAQNFVLNPGLESLITCPGFGQFGSAYISNWSKPSIGSTDYYSYLCVGLEPIGQVPHAGQAYFGIIAYNYSGEYREYATAQLSSPLVGGVQYTVEFYVSLAEGYIQAVHELGAYLSATAPGPFSNSLHIAVTPQIENATLLSNYTAWMLVSGTFIATGGEQYITIGNFNDDANTTVVQVSSSGSYGAYYFVDDVSVMELPTGIDSKTLERFSVYPNPASTQLIIDNVQLKAKIVMIYDVLGNNVSTLDVINTTAKLSVDVSGLSPGIYFLTVNNSSARTKLLIQR